MAFADLIEQVLALPEKEREIVADAVWESLHRDSPGQWHDEAELLATLERRAEELASGKVQGIPYDEVKRRVAQRLTCK